MTFTFLAPGFLWFLAVVPLLWFVPRRVRDARHGLIRSALIAALVLGLARPVLLDDGEAPRHVIVLDRSASLSADGDTEALASLDRLLAVIPADAEKILVDLCGETRREASRQLAGTRPDIGEWIHVSGDGESSLSTALAVAGSVIPRGAPGAVTLLTDGLATDTHWGSAFGDLMDREIPLHTVALGVDETDPRPVALVFDETIRAGHTSQVRVRLLGQAAGVRVTLSSDGQTLAQREGLSIRGQLDLAMRFEPRAPGFHDMVLNIEVTEGADPRPGTNSLTERVAVQDPLRLLYLGHRMQGGKDKLSELLGSGYDVVEPEPQQGPEILHAVDAVMLDDRPAKQLSENWRKGIADAVTNRGLGLLASGGRAAFGSGGYHRTEIEELLPVEFVQKEEKKDPSTTLAIIIDSSGSMVGNRMTLAKQVARLAMRRLQPHDKIGIVEFYGTKSWAAPIQSAANQIDLQRALNRLDAGGGTVLMPAIEEAYYAMKNVQTRYKHVLVLTDAGVETGPYESLLRRMSDEGMTVSTVLVGPGRHSDFLVDLADWGGGRYYNATDRFSLPELLLKKPSTSVLPAYRPERVEVDTAGGPGWWGDLDPTELPPIDGFVECELRPGAEELMSTAKTDTPILATKLHGLGRVTAFMSEPLGAGTKSWAEWKGYGALLGRVIARTARGHQPPFEYSLDRRFGRIFLEARKLVRQDLVPVCHLLNDEGGKVRELELREVAPGVYRHETTWRPDVAFEIVATTIPGPGSSGGGAMAPFSKRLLVSGARADIAPESQVDPSQRFPLEQASAFSGGRSLAADAASFELSSSVGRAPNRLTQVWPWFVLASLILLALDVFHRRRVVPQREIA